MRTDVETYRQDLLLALRMRDVPGARIAEALAEVDSHLAETGEDPRTGADMAAPLPRWVLVVLVAAPCGVLVLGLLASAAQR